MNEKTVPLLNTSFLFFSILLSTKRFVPDEWSPLGHFDKTSLFLQNSFVENERDEHKATYLFSWSFTSESFYIEERTLGELRMITCSPFLFGPHLWMTS